MNEFPILESSELVLRQLEMSDYDNYLEYVQDEMIKKQFNFDYTEESAKKRLEEIVSKYTQERKPFIWAIALKKTNEFIGIISINSISFGNKKFSIAYGIRASFRRNDYAYKASVLLIDFVFNNLDMHRLELAHNIDNIASEKTIQKLGGRFEGIARESKFYDGVFKDRKTYSILREEWREK